jgi:hypothetical protein
VAAGAAHTEADSSVIFPDAELAFAFPGLLVDSRSINDLNLL